MVFNLSSRKKKNKIPKRNSKVKIETNSQQNVTVTNNVILSAEQFPNTVDPTLYNKISPSRAIFESRKLESACSFLKCLKQKLENDVKGSTNKSNTSTSGNITDILSTLIDVNDNITPMVSDVSTKWINQNSSSGSSTISEHHFNRTLAATNKLLQLTNKPKNDASYYFTHKIIANNAEEVTIFEDSIHSIGEKIYIDKGLLTQLVELHALLKDTIQKLRDQEEISKPDTNEATMYQTARSTTLTLPSKQESIVTSKSGSASKFGISNTNLYTTASSFPPSENTNIPPSSIVIAPTGYKIEEAQHENTSVVPPGSVIQSPQMSFTSETSSLLRASKMKRKEKRASKSSMKNATTLIVGPPPPIPELTPEIQYELPVVIKQEISSAHESTSTADLEGTFQYCDPQPEQECENSRKRCCKCDALETDVINNGTMTPSNFLQGNLSSMEQQKSKQELESQSVLRKDASTMRTGTFVRICPRKNCSVQTQKPTDTPAKSFVDRLMCRECKLRKKTNEKPKPEKSTTFGTSTPIAKGLGSENAYKTVSGVSKRSTLSSDIQDISAIQGSKMFVKSGTTEKSTCSLVDDISSGVNRSSALAKASITQKSGNISRSGGTEKSTTFVNNISGVIDRPGIRSNSEVIDRFGTMSKSRDKSEIMGNSQTIDRTGIMDNSQTIDRSGIMSKSQTIDRSGILSTPSSFYKSGVVDISGTTRSSLINKSYNSSKKFESVAPQYIDGIDKCLAELDCMRNCLKEACVTKESLHECIKIFPEGEEGYLQNDFPHFHTFINGVPVVIQINKELASEDGSCCKYQYQCSVSTTDKGNMCCIEKAPEPKPPLACRVLDSLSRSRCTRWGSNKRKKSKQKSETNGMPEKSMSEKAKNSGKADFTVYKKIKLMQEKLYISKDNNSLNNSLDKSFPEDDKAVYDTVNMQNETIFDAPIYNTPASKHIPPNVIDAESTESLPYIAARNSLPKLDNPDKICSSLLFDVKTMSVTFEKSKLNHPNEIINRALKRITVEELLDSFRPAKCCRKTVLNEKPHGTMPYAVSLQSLPLLACDLDTIIRIIESNIPALFKTQTLYEHYINFQKNIESGSNKDTFTTPTPNRQVFQVYFFEIFKKDEEDKPKEQSSSKSSSTNTFNDLRILDFIKRIYTSEPLYEKVSKKHDPDGDNKHKKLKKEKNTKNRHHEKKEYRDKKSTHPTHQKYKKTERKSFYSSVESYLTSKSNFGLNSSVSSQVSTKITQSRNSNMYSFLLIPKSELNSYSSSNELSTSYAPSMNSLPFEDAGRRSSTSTPTPNLTPESSSEDYDEFGLSPCDFAKTLEAIYELDKNGNMRPKAPISKESALAVIQHFPLPPAEIRNFTDNLRNLSTIYEADEKNITKESDGHIFSSSLNCHPSRSKNDSLRNCTTTRKSNEPSKIPISIHSNNSFTKSKISKLIKTSKPLLDSQKIDLNEVQETNRLCLPSDLSKAYFFNTQEKTNLKLVDASTSTGAISTEVIAKVHPKICGIRPNQIKTEPITNKQSVHLQGSLHRANTLELPVTFDIVKPTKRRSCNIAIEPSVMSYDISSEQGVVTGDIKCYRSENMCMWPQLQKKFETTNKAFYVSVHDSHFTIPGKQKSENLTSQIQVLQQHPVLTQNKYENNKEKAKQLSTDNFLLGYTGNSIINTTTTTKSVLKKASIFDKASEKPKRKFKNICPEVIDIKVSKNVKSTKLKHKIFKDGDRPGYVSVLSTPCDCPDITIFLPCCCGKAESCGVPLVREAQQYTMVPMVEKYDKHK